MARLPLMYLLSIPFRMIVLVVERKLKKMVIGTFAYCGSGQDTLADSICKLYNFKKYSLGDILRKIAEERGMKSTRETLQNIRRECDIKYGRSYLPDKIVDLVKFDGCSNVIITGIRTLEEYRVLKLELNMKFLFVYADNEIRMKRMLRRHSDKDEESVELLERNMLVESLMFDYEELKKMSDYEFDFNMDLSDYIKNEKQIVKEVIQNMEDKSNG